MLHIVTIAARFAKFANDVQRRYRLQSLGWSPEQIVAVTQAGQAQQNKSEQVEPRVDLSHGD